MRQQCGYHCQVSDFKSNAVATAGEHSGAENGHAAICHGEAKIDKDVDKSRHSIELLRELWETWQEAMKLHKAGK